MRLASLLLRGNPDAGAVSFHRGGVVCLKREERGWSVEWVIIPEIIED